MSDDGPKRSGKRAPRTKLVTLRFNGPPLDLPEERLRREVEQTPSWVPPPAVERPTPKPEAPPPEGADGWEREKRERGSAVHPAVPDVDELPSSVPRNPLETLSPATIPLDSEAPPRDALSLVERGHRITGSLDLRAEMRERFALGDFTGALRSADLLLGRAPEDQEAQRTAEVARIRLEDLLMTRLGTPELCPQVAVADADVRWLGLDRQAALLFGRVDGRTSLEALLDGSGMRRLEALRGLVALVDAGAIRVEQ